MKISFEQHRWHYGAVFHIGALLGIAFGIFSMEPGLRSFPGYIGTILGGTAVGGLSACAPIALRNYIATYGKKEDLDYTPKKTWRSLAEMFTASALIGLGLSAAFGALMIAIEDVALSNFVRMVGAISTTTIGVGCLGALILLLANMTEGAIRSMVKR